MDDQTPEQIRFFLLWALALGIRIPLSADMPVDWQQEVEKLVDEKRAGVTDDVKLAALPHPQESRYTDEANAAVRTAIKIMLLDLEEVSPRPGNWATQRCAEFGIDYEHVRLAVSRLRGDKLVLHSDGQVTPAFTPHRQNPPLTLAKLGIKPVKRSVPPRPSAPPEAPAAPQPSAPSAAEPALDDFDSAPPAAPPETPETPSTSANALAAPHPSAPVRPESRAPVRQEDAPAAPESPKPAAPPPPPARREPTAPAASSTPEPSAPPIVISQVPDIATHEILSEISTAVTALTRWMLNPHQRVRTPLGISPLHDTMRQIAVAILSEEEPITATVVTQSYLSKHRRTFLEPALAEGVRLGAFARTGGIGPTHRGARYALVDPVPLGVTWEELHQVVEERRRRRAVG